MIKTLKSSVTIVLLALGLLVTPVVFATQTAFADTAASKKAACDGVALTGSNCNGESENSVRSLISTIVSVLSIIVGIVAVIMIIVAGFKYITSGGDSSNVSSAKNTLLYAVIGLVIVALAQVIVRFVLNQVPGS